MDRNEKREHPRFKIEEATVFLGKEGFLSSLGLGPRKRPVVNLSPGGAMIQTGKRLAVGSRIELKIDLPKTKDVIAGVAEVRWCAQSAKNDGHFYAGLSFVELAPKDQQKIVHLYELVTSAGYRARAAVRKEASSAKLQPPRL